jgi:hypothetical protein
MIISNDIYNGMPIETFIHTLKSKAIRVYRMVVPSLNKPTRLKLVSTDQFDSMRAEGTFAYYTHIQEVGREENVEMLLGEEVGDLTRNRGVLLAGIAGDPTLQGLANEHANFKAVIDFLLSFGHKGHERGCSEHLGLATYRSERFTSRPQPRPNQNPLEVGRHQYFVNAHQTRPLIQQRMEQLIYLLGKKAEESMVAIMGPFGIEVQGICDKLILTSGISSNAAARVPQRAIKFLSFCCTSHCDAVDLLKNDDVLDDFKERSKTNTYVMELLDTLKNIGLPTSCQYFHVWNDITKKDDYDVNSYFIHRGLGVAHPLKHMDGVAFLGYAYTHCTSFCYLTTTEDSLKKVIISNDPNDIFSMLAWGNSGGKNEYRRARGMVVEV